MSYGAARSAVILAPILLSTDISRDTMTPLKNQAQDGALRWERLDDLHPLYLKGAKKRRNDDRNQYVEGAIHSQGNR